MRNIFILNPAAGQGLAARMEERILHASRETQQPVELYHTNRFRDGEAYVRSLCSQKQPGDRLRFYGCGGDGTLNEVVNGCYGHPQVEVGMIPMGTGNDFIRDFGSLSDFNDLKGQLNGVSRPVDLIHFHGVLNGWKQDRYCASMINIGYDCNVVYRTSKMKRLPMISGSLAYLAGIFIELIEKSGADLKITKDGQTLHDGRVLLTSVANGRYCGGGLIGSPLAVNDDGQMDVQIIRDVKRSLIMQLLPKYAKGTHLKDAKASKHINYQHVTSLEIQSNQDPLRICVDGEMELLEGPLSLELIPGGFQFLVPVITP